MENSTSFTCTSRFQERDFLFLTTVVADQGDEDAFRRFISDREELLSMLDDERVLQTILESPDLLGVSPAFYFYVLVRHSLMQSGIDDTELSEFLGAVLIDRMPVGKMGAGLGPKVGFVHSFDFLTMLNQVSGEMRFELLLTAGNEFLVLTGMFPDYITAREKRKGAPGIGYYEEFARASYQQAGNHPRARERGMSEVLENLSSVLPQARRSLNRMADALVFLSS